MVSATRSLWIRGLLLALLAAGVIAVWQWTPLGGYASAERLAGLAEQLRESPWCVPIVVAGFIIGGLLFLPLTAMLLATALTLPTIDAFALAHAGTFASALCGFLAGRLLGAKPLRRFTGSTAARISRSAGRHGMLLVCTLRLVPVAHFSVVNLAAGASHIRLWDYGVGTLLGTLPGTILVIAASGPLLRFIESPDAGGLLVLTAIVGIGVLGIHVLARYLRKP